MIINAEKYDNTSLNQIIRQQEKDVTIDNCLGERFIGCGLSNRRLTVNGISGNALGCYLNGAEIVVNGNAQDAVGDTMNAGSIVIHGNVGDAAGYAMRGGKIYVEGNAGYRTGIHMKAYKDKLPVIVIGGRCGSFLGEYQAGGLIIVLGMHKDGKNIVGNFPCTGMHGGKVFLKGCCDRIVFPPQVNVSPATDADLKEIYEHVKEFCDLFGCDFEQVISSQFTVITPDSANPYKQMYVEN